MAPEAARLASAAAALPLFGAQLAEKVPTLPVEVPAMAKKTAGVRVVAGSDAPFRGIVGEESGSGAASGGNRSVEHTSELQSLMGIAYAVFCLTKKKHTC